MIAIMSNTTHLYVMCIFQRRYMADACGFYMNAHEHTPGSDLQRSSAAWRASGPVSAAAQPARLDQRSLLWTEPWWSRWSEQEGADKKELHAENGWNDGGSKTKDIRNILKPFWNSFLYSPAVWTLLLPHEIWLLQSPTAPSGVHLMSKTKVWYLCQEAVFTQTAVLYSFKFKWTACSYWYRPGRKAHCPARHHGLR